MHSIPNAIEVNLPDDFDFLKQRDYKIEHGRLLYDPETVQKG